LSEIGFSVNMYYLPEAGNRTQ